jgi:hypothetical protein
VREGCDGSCWLSRRRCSSPDGFPGTRPRKLAAQAVAMSGSGWRQVAGDGLEAIDGRRELRKAAYVLGRATTASDAIVG